MHGTAKKTGGGLHKKDLMYNAQGKIVSKRASKSAKKSNNLVNAGYVTQKGVFGAVNTQKGGNNLINVADEFGKKIEKKIKESRIELNKLIQKNESLKVNYEDLDNLHKLIENIKKKKITFTDEATNTIMDIMMTVNNFRDLSLEFFIGDYLEEFINVFSEDSNQIENKLNGFKAKLNANKYLL